MREILFRGKRIDTGEWVEGYPVKSVNDKYYLITYITEDSINTKNEVDFIYQEVKPETIGQFTGLTDKNGVKIFEGDILKVPEDWNEYGVYAGEVYEVYFAFGGFRMKPKYNLNNKGFWIEDDKTFEVIGNIHDNHELLEEK